MCGWKEERADRRLGSPKGGPGPHIGETLGQGRYCNEYTAVHCLKACHPTPQP